MGGFGSGRPREVTRGTVESYRWIDIHQLAHAGLHWTGWSGLVQWPVAGGRHAAAISICADGDRVVLSYHFPGTGTESEVHDTISLVHLGCPFGDGRRYFECPGFPGRPCQRRVVRLYLVGRSFRCRHCHRLAYASQSETAENRAFRRATKIRMRLGGRGGYARPFPDRPKRMWHRTYNGLRLKATFAELQAREAWVAQSQRWLRKKGARDCE
jgi:hypothetical protein